MLLTLALLTAMPFGELPPKPVGGTAQCLRATGAPGEIAHSKFHETELLRADAGGFTRVGTLPAAVQENCPALAANLAGAGVAAIRKSDTGISAYVRDAGGSFGSEQTLATAAPPQAIQVAESETGDAVVAWTEHVRGHYAIRAARRTPGGGFGAPLDVPGGADDQPSNLQAAVAGGGEIVLTWMAGGHVRAAIAGAGFGPQQAIGDAQGAPQLAGAPDGRALIAFWTGNEVRVAERAPGGSFAPATTLATTTDRYGVQPAVAVRSGGGAVVAWYALIENGASAAVRPGPGAFSAPVALSPASKLFTRVVDPLILQLLSELGGDTRTAGTTVDETGGALDAAITPDGRALLTWAAARDRAGELWNAPETATLPLAGGHLDRQTLGTPLRNVSTVGPALLAGGTPAVVWTDNDEDERNGRLHLAIEGATEAADPPAPRIRISVPRRHVLRATEGLAIGVTCSAACDLEAGVPGQLGVMASGSRTSKGIVTLDLQPVKGPLAPLRAAPVSVRVLYGGRGARHPLTKTVSVTLRRTPGPARPHVRRLSARRRAGGIDIRITTDRPIRGDRILVLGTATRDRDARVLETADLSKAKRRTFAVRMQPAAGVRYVTVVLPGLVPFTLDRTTVKVH